MTLVFSILLQIIALFFTLITLVFLMAGGANSTPKQLRELKIMLWGVFFVGLSGLVGFIFALIYGRYGTACLLGAYPIVACIGLIVWLFITGAPKPDPSARDDGW